MMLRLSRRSGIFLGVFLFLQSLAANSGSRCISADYFELEQAAREKDLYAAAFLSLVHAHGDKGKDVSIEEALEYAEQAVAQNHWLGHFAMGYLARFVPYGPDPEKVRKHYLKAFQDPDGKLIREASKGDPVAAYALAEIFTSDEVRPTVIPDLQMAASYYEIASEAGYGPASVQLALFKLHSIADPGLGIEKDLPGGMDLLIECARENLPSAHHYLGRCYFKGIGVEADNDMALVHFQAAADKGMAISQLLVADFYAYGVSGPVKLDLAKRYAHLASTQERDKAMIKLGEYEQLNTTEPKNAPQSPQAASEFSQVGNQLPSVPAPDLPPVPPPPFSAQRLPSVYESTPSSTQSGALLESVSIEDKSSETSILQPRQDPTVSRNAAKSAYWGKGEQVDLNKAYSLFLSSAEAGDGESARYLGMMHMQGKGTQKDYRQALDWFEIAAQRGDQMALANLKKLKEVLGAN